MKSTNQGTRIGIAIFVILGVIVYLAITGVQSNKSYYVTIQELQGMGTRPTRATYASLAMCSPARSKIGRAHV